MNKSNKWMKLVVMSMFVIIMSFSLGCSKESVPGDDINGMENQETETRKEFRSDSGEMSIMATDLWAVDEGLHEESELSLYNEEYQSYLIILTDEKKVFSENTTLEEYGNLVSESTLEGLLEGTVSEGKTIEVNGFDAREFLISGLVDEISVTYKFLVLEDDSKFFQVIIWSFSENIKNNAEYYDEILHSYNVISEVSD